MTPEEIKRKYQDLLNNEIFLADPISWMQNDSEFIVMTAIVGYSRRRCYAKVALCEVKKGVVPKMISKRARGMVFIWELHNHLPKAWTKDGYENTLARVTKRCAELNAEVARLAVIGAYDSAVLKLLADKYAWTPKMSAANPNNFRIYVTAYREQGRPVEEAAEYMNRHRPIFPSTGTDQHADEASRSDHCR
jgi:hypothetical protein